MNGANAEGSRVHYGEDHRRPLLPDESANGYVARRAAADFLPRMFNLTAGAGASSARHSSPLLLEPSGVVPLATDLGVDVSALCDRVLRDGDHPGLVRIFGNLIDRRHVISAIRRFAPKQLRESAHHRALWMLTPFPFCGDTWQFLIDRCPSPHCEAVQKWRWTVGVGLCDRCGGPLDRAVAEEVPARLQRQLTWAIGLLHPDRARQVSARLRLPSVLAEVSTRGILDLLCAIAGVVDPGIRLNSARHLIAPTATPRRVAEAIATSWSILEGWPQSFEDMASQRLAARPGKHGDGNAGATTAFLFLPTRCTMEAGAAAAILHMRERFMANHSRGYSPAEAAAICATRLSTMIAARREGRISTIFHLDGRRATAMLDRKAVDAAKGTSRVPYHVAAGILGVTYRAIEELVATDMLDAAPLEPSARAVLAVTDRSLQDLIAGIRARAVNHLAPGSMTLNAAMRGVAGLKPWSGAIRAMIDGSLSFSLPTGSAGDVREALVPKSAWKDLRTIAVARTIEEGLSEMMSKADAADALTLLPRQYATLLSRWPTSHGWERTVPIANVVDMSRVHVPAAEIALRLDIQSRKVRLIMAANHVERLSDAGYDRIAFEALLASGFTV